jgi:hypothetical protein
MPWFKESLTTVVGDNAITVAFYERCVSSKNFSNAGGKTYLFDRQPLIIPVSRAPRLSG